MTGDVSDPRARLAPSVRPLTAAEQRLIRNKISDLTARGRRAERAAIPAMGGAILVLWVATLMASDTPWFIVTAFWVVVGGALAWWVGRDLRTDTGHLRDMAVRLESALKKNAAEVYDIRAHAFAELEEVEDEGAGYVFELDDNRLVFVSGQEFYESARFPSLDFSLVYVLDELNVPCDMFIDKRGAKTTPIKTIAAADKIRIDVPSHLEICSGRIVDLESVLGLTID